MMVNRRIKKDVNQEDARTKWYVNVKDGKGELNIVKIEEYIGSTEVHVVWSMEGENEG